MMINLNSNAKWLTGLNKSQESMEKSVINVAAATRINKAIDDPSGLAISTRMELKSSSLKTGENNLLGAMEMMRSAESATGSVSKLIFRMRELAVQAKNGAYSAEDKNNLAAEMAELKKEYDHTVQTAAYNGITVLNNATGSYEFNTGNGRVTVNTADLTSGVGNPVDLEGLDLTTEAGAETAINKLDQSLNAINRLQTGFSSARVKLESHADYLLTHDNELQAALSRIKDTDMARELSNVTKTKILSQSNVMAIHQNVETRNAILALFN